MYSHGPGVWRLNLDLSDKDFCAVIVDVIEEGEKPSKYFFRLESNCIEKSLVNSHGVEVFSQPEIKQAHFNFYRSLYSKEPVHLSLQQTLLLTWMFL